MNMLGAANQIANCPSTERAMGFIDAEFDNLFVREYSPAPCGDGFCDPSVGEDSSTCPQDCPAVCGDGFCDPTTENPSNCPQDCFTGVCTDNNDCASNQYCAKVNCDAQQGKCGNRPSNCGNVYLPVCGCDGKTYGNACLAAKARVIVARVGTCS